MRGLPASALGDEFDPATWQEAVRGADSPAALRRLLGEVSAACAA